MTIAWAFLHDSFRAIQGALCIGDSSISNQDAIQLGCDGDELWIDVRIDDGNAKTADQRLERCRVLHEALVLTSIVAIADYAAWRYAVLSISELRIPTAVDVDETPLRLQPQFRLALPTESQFTWTHIQQILRCDQQSDHFVKLWTKATETAARLGVSLTDPVKRPVIRVDDCPVRVERQEQVKRIHSMIDTVVAFQGTHMNSLETLWLESISLSLQNYDMHSVVFGAIRTLVETGVHIKSIEMPSYFPDDEIADEEFCFEAWALLVCSLCGRPQQPTERPVRVDKLVLDTSYSFREFVFQLFTVLGQARRLKSLKLARLPYGDPQRFFWLWLGATLFRPDSHCAAEVLDLDMIVLSTTAIENLRDVMTTEDPMLLLWQRTTQTDSNTSSVSTVHREITVPAGTIVRPYGDPGTFLADFTVSVNWSGLVIFNDPSKTAIDVLLFGIGFCEIDRRSVPNKQRRVEPLQPHPVDHVRRTQHRIQRLLIGANSGDLTTQDGCSVDELLRLVGADLIALSLSDPDVDDMLLGQCLELCPRLESLCLARCDLVTMIPLIESYERGGRISSLELSAIQVLPEFLPEFEKFLKTLLTPSAMKRTLKKLCIGYQWASLFQQSTANAIKEVLNDTLTLNYLHIYRYENLRIEPLIDWDLASHNGEIVPVYGIPPLRVRLAFASVIKYLRTQERFARLEMEMMATVLEFVGQTTKRVMIS